MDLKRCFDVVGAFVGLVVTAPLIAVIALCVLVDVGWPVLFAQRRPGLGGRPFTIVKFRSMLDLRDADGVPLPDAERLTRFGRLLRATSLDELPELWNVLVGDMSFVGPRPERPEFVAELTKQIPFFGQRHVVRPGVTGWAQVRHRYGNTVEDALEKLQYDLFYIKHLSLWLDISIILRTIKIVLLGRGAC
jgi:lipopolysaccharide/colanic/teichoic acid biosynthesis glycosyltransferase